MRRLLLAIVVILCAAVPARAQNCVTVNGITRCAMPWQVYDTAQRVVSTPVLDLRQTWNQITTTFTGVQLNVTDTNSASGSLLLDLQVGGTSKFSVTKGGALTATGAITAAGVTSTAAIKAPDGTTAAPGWTFSSQSDLGFYRAASGDLRFTIGSSTDQFRVTASNLFFRNNENIGWTNSTDPAGTATTWFSMPANGALLMTASGSNVALQLRATQGTAPTITNGGGTSPVCVGTDTFMACTIGTLPPAQATFTVTFNGTWAAAPSCIATRGTTGTTPVVTAAVTSTTTIVVNLSANLVASERYNIQCGGVQ